MPSDSRSRRRGRRDRFHVEYLECRELLTVQFARPVYVVGNTTPAAIVTLVRDPNPMIHPEVASFTTGEGTARPDVDYTPVSEKVIFGDGEFTKQVRIPLRNEAPTGDERALKIAVRSKDSLGNDVVSEATVSLLPRDDIVPPIIEQAVQLRQRRRVTGFRLTFSEELDPGAAGDVRNYAVIAHSPPREGFSLSAEPSQSSSLIRLKRAEYDPTTRSVTLTVARPHRPAFAYEIAQNSGLTDVAGNRLDGNRDGVADGTLYAQASRFTRDRRTLEFASLKRPAPDSDTNG